MAAVTGYIWLFYSERMFWSFWRTADGFADSVATWVVYTVAAHACLTAIQRFRVRSVWAVLLIGALFGWLIEGVFAMTLFGADGIPFPLTISWTGLAWHDLVSVTLGWYALQLAIRHALWPTIMLSLGLGTFWGLWSLSWVAADPAAAPDTAAFSLHAFGAALPMIAASYAYRGLRSADFAPGRLQCLATALIILAWFAGVTVPRLGGFAPAALLPLFLLVWWGLRRNREGEPGPNLLALLDAPINRRCAAAMLLMPAAAVAIYGVCRSREFAAATNIPIFVATTAAGFGALIVALAMVGRKPRGV